MLYTTHYMEEAEELCHRIGVIDNGRILAEGTLDELKHLVGAAEIVTIRGNFILDHAKERVRQLGVPILSDDEQRLVLSTGDADLSAAELLGRIFKLGIPIDSVAVEPPSLGGLFLKLTGRELRD